MAEPTGPGTPAAPAAPGTPAAGISVPIPSTEGVDFSQLAQGLMEFVQAKQQDITATQAQVGATREADVALSRLLGTLVAKTPVFTQFTGAADEGMRSVKSQFDSVFDLVSKSSGLEGLKLLASKLKIGTLIDFSNLETAKTMMKGIVDDQLDQADAASRTGAQILSSARDINRLPQILAAATQVSPLDALNPLITQRLENVKRLTTEHQMGSDAASNFVNMLTRFRGWDKDIKIGDETMSSFDTALYLQEALGLSTEELKTKLTALTQEYGMELDKALEYIARQSDIIEKTGMLPAVIQSAIDGTVKATAGLGYSMEANEKIALSGAESYLEYSNALLKVGTTEQRTAGIIGSAITKVISMSDAQAAFLSARTGGPGGALGAIQMEQKLAKEGPKALLDLAMKDMRQRLPGARAIDFEKVTTQADASQLRRQADFLQQMGYAANKRDAFAMLKAEAARQEGRVGISSTLELSRDPLADRVRQGRAQEEALGRTQIGRVMSSLEGLKIGTATVSREDIFSRVGEGSMAGLSPERQEDQRYRLEALRIIQAGQTEASAKAARQSGAALTGEKPDVNLNTGTKESLSQAIDAIKATFASAPKSAANDAVIAQLEAAKASLAAEGKKEGTPGSGLRASAEAAASARKGKKGEAADGAEGVLRPTVVVPNVDLSFTAICAHCTQPIEASQQRLATATVEPPAPKTIQGKQPGAK